MQLEATQGHRGSTSLGSPPGKWVVTGHFPRERPPPTPAPQAKPSQAQKIGKEGDTNMQRDVLRANSYAEREIR